MKRRISLLSSLLILFAFQLSAQNRITVTLEDFSALTVSGRADVELVFSESHEMSITARNGEPEDVDYEVKNGELKIKTKPDLKKENTISIKLPYSSLTHIEALNGAVINSKKDLKVEDLELKVYTGGKIELSVECKNIDARITQVSDIILYGKTGTQNVSANSGGNYLAYDLECEDTYAKASSGAQIKVRATRKIEATANSKGFVGYVGDPVSTYVKTSLGGEVASFKTNPDSIEN